MFQRILVAWDGSELAQRALHTGVDIALRYEAEVVAASVLTPPGGRHPEGGSETLDDAHRRLEARFARVREEDLAGVPVSHEMIEGRHPGKDLLAYVHEHGFDLVVIGHHRDPHPGVLVLHGVTEEIVADADVPVLVVGG